MSPVGLSIFIHPLGEQFQEDGLLGGKMVVESAFANPGLLADPGHACAVVARFAETPGGRLQDAPVGFFCPLLLNYSI